MVIGANQFDLDRGFEGQIANIQHYNHIRGTQENFRNGTNEFIPFGSMVARIPGGEPGALRIAQAGDVILGVAILNDRFMAQLDETFGSNSLIDDGGRRTGFPPNQTMPVLAKGVVYLRFEQTVPANTPLFFRTTENAVPGVGERLGRPRLDADGGNAEQVPGNAARLTENAFAGEVAAVEFDITPLI